MSEQKEVAPSDVDASNFIAKLSEDERNDLLPRLETVDAKPGKFIIREGSEGSDLYFIVQGKCKVCKTDTESKEVILALLGPGDVIGEIALLTSSKRTADVISLTASRLLCCSQTNFYEHAAKFSGLSLLLLRYEANRVRAASARIADLALYDVTSRLGRVLFEMSTTTILPRGEQHVVNDPPTHQALASMIGASREAVTRALKLLEDEGHIEVDDGRIWVNSLPH